MPYILLTTSSLMYKTNNRLNGHFFTNIFIANEREFSADIIAAFLLEKYSLLQAMLIIVCESNLSCVVCF